MASIILSGKEFPIKFTMNLQEKVSDRYGDVSQITAQVFRYSEAKWLLAEAINEGYRFDQYFNGSDPQKVTEEEIGTITSFYDFSSGRIAQALLDALNESISGENDQKKISMEDLAELGSNLIQKMKK